MVSELGGGGSVVGPSISSKEIRCLLFGTCVDFQMLVEGVPLSEASAALLALVRPGAGVDVGVVPQVFFGSEALPARLAHERFLA